MSLDIKDDTTAVSETIARDRHILPLRNRLAALRAAYPLPPRTGHVADKAFFDALSGEPD